MVRRPVAINGEGNGGDGEIVDGLLRRFGIPDHPILEVDGIVVGASVRQSGNRSRTDVVNVLDGHDRHAGGPGRKPASSRGAGAIRHDFVGGQRRHRHIEAFQRVQPHIRQFKYDPPRYSRSDQVAEFIRPIRPALTRDLASERRSGRRDVDECIHTHLIIIKGQRLKVARVEIYPVHGRWRQKSQPLRIRCRDVGGHDKVVGDGVGADGGRVRRDSDGQLSEISRIGKIGVAYIRPEGGRKGAGDVADCGLAKQDNVIVFCYPEFIVSQGEHIVRAIDADIGAGAA